MAYESLELCHDSRGGVDQRLAPVFDLVIFGTIALMVGVLLDKWVLIPAVLFFATAAVAVHFLDHGFWFLTAAYIVSPLALAVGDLIYARGVGG